MTQQAGLPRSYKDNCLILRARGDLDLHALADLWVASWQEAMPGIDFPRRRSWFCDHVRKLETKGAVTICGFDAGEQLVGFLVLDASNGHIDQLVVTPPAKGTGAAILLLDEARRLSPARLQLEVNVDNPRALRFYEREGFAKIGEATNPLSGLPTWRLAWLGK